MIKKVQYQNKTPSIIEINGRQYAINLEWRSKQSPDDTPIKINKANIKEIRPSQDYNCYVGMSTLDESYIQVGFSDKQLTPIKTHSLAMSLTGKTDKTEIFVFKINEDQSYILFYQNGIIDPGTDLLGKSEDIEEYAKEIIDENDIGVNEVHLYNDSIDEAIKKIESILLIKDKKIPVIKSVNFSFKEVPKQVYLATGAVIFLSVGFFSYNEYSSYIEIKKEKEEQKERMEKLREEREKKEKVKEENAKKKVEELVKLKEQKVETIFKEAIKNKPEPWNKYGEPVDLLEMCINNIKNSPVFRSTWKLRQASCNGDKVETIYERNGVLNVSSFLDNNPNAKINPEGNIATISKQTLYKKKDIDENIPQSIDEYNDVKYKIIGFFQDRPDITYQFNQRPSNQAMSAGELSPKTRDIQRRLFNMSQENVEKINLEDYETYVEKLEVLPTKEEIENMNINDLPSDKIETLREQFRENWQQEYLVLRSANSISWFSGLYSDTPGLRVSRVDLNILPNNSIEWVIESPLYFKQ